MRFLVLLVLAALALGCSTSGGNADCAAGCLCYRSDEGACKSNGCPWSVDGGYCYNGPTPGDGGTE